MNIIFPGEAETPFLIFWAFILLSGPALGILIGILTRFETGFVIGTFIPALIGFFLRSNFFKNTKILSHQVPIYIQAKWSTLNTMEKYRARFQNYRLNQ